MFHNDGSSARERAHGRQPHSCPLRHPEALANPQMFRDQECHRSLRRSSYHAERDDDGSRDVPLFFLFALSIHCLVILFYHVEELWQQFQRACRQYFLAMTGPLREVTQHRQWLLLDLGYDERREIFERGSSWCPPGLRLGIIERIGGRLGPRIEAPLEHTSTLLIAWRRVY